MASTTETVVASLCDYTPQLTQLSSALADHVLTTVNMVSPLTCRTLVKQEELDIELEFLESDDLGKAGPAGPADAAAAAATPAPADIPDVNVKLEEPDNDIVPPERRSSRLQERPPAPASSSSRSRTTSPPHALSRTLYPAEEAKVISILPVIVVNLQDGAMLDKQTRPRKCKQTVIATANVDVTLFEAPRSPLAFYGSQWAKDGRFLGPERFASILVFPDIEGLEILRKGVANHWGEDDFIKLGYGMVSVDLRFSLG